MFPLRRPLSPREIPRDSSGFQSELRRRVNEYFQATGQSERGGWRIYFKTAIVFNG